MDFQAMNWDQIKDSQQTPRVRAYKQFKAAFDTLLQSDDPKVVQARAKEGRSIMALKSGDVHTVRALDNLAIAYANEDYIGDQLIPLVPVKKKSDLYWIRSRRDITGFPDDAMAGEGQAKRISKELSTDNYTAQDHGLSDFVEQDSIDNQDEVLDEMGGSVELVSEGLAFNRELRQVTLLTTAGNYGGNTAAVGTAWNTAGSNPIADVQTARSKLWQGRGPSRVKGFCSLDVYLVLSRHPMLLDLFKYGATQPDASGLITPSMIAAVFGLDELVIGKAWKDTANQGQTASYSRMWGNVFGIVRYMEGASRRNNAGFAARFEYAKPRVIIEFAARSGLKGGWHIQETNSDIDLVVGEPTGYLLTGVL